MTRRKKKDFDEAYEEKIVVAPTVLYVSAKDGIHELAIEITTPYRNDFVTAIKDCIPAKHRDFDYDLKIWLVFDDWIDTALDLVRMFYSDVVLFDTRGGEPLP